MTTIEQFRAALEADAPVFGLWATIPAPLAAEAMAAAGPGYVVVDQQHGAIEPATLAALLMAIQARGPAPLVRVAHNDPTTIGHALDLGAFGVIVPMVDDAAAAARAVAACRYAPRGIRSYGPLRNDLALGSADPEVLGGPLCLVMVETRAALDAVEEIARTPGLDGIYIGPSDLALSLGLKPTLRLEHPPVLEALDRIQAACREAGILCGVHCLHPDDAAERSARGFSPVTAATDSAVLRAGVAAALATARGRSE